MRRVKKGIPICILEAPKLVLLQTVKAQIKFPMCNAKFHWNLPLMAAILCLCRIIPHTLHVRIQKVLSVGVQH